MYTLVDTAAVVTNKLAALKAKRVTTIFRYITNSTTQRKLFKPAEAVAFQKANMHVILNFENLGGSRNMSDIDAAHGMVHGAFARGYAPKVGAPPSAVIYFSVDTGTSAATLRNHVLPYFKAVHAELAGHYRIGVYGCGDCCKAMKAAGYASHTWLANAMGWAGSKAYRNSNAWHVLQHLPVKNFVPGIAVDPDDINLKFPDIGSFVPWSTK